jgi:hypothetical protein
MDEAEVPPSLALRRLVDGYQISQSIHVAAVLGIADHLVGGPRISDELAGAVDANPDTLYRLLRALASVGVFREDGERRFSLTPLGECLRSDAPEPLAGWASFIGRSYYWDAWSDLLTSIRTGENTFRHRHGMSPWEYRVAHPEENGIFNRAMMDVTRRTNRAVIAAFDFSRFAIAADIGGGSGALVAGLLAANPAMRGVLFDQPHVVAQAAPLLSEAAVADRCEVVGGNFFESVPAGADAYILKAILHDWEDDQAIAILRVCREAIPASGAVLVVEHNIEPPNQGRDGKFSDINMIVGPGGRERTLDEYAALFGASGFRLAGATPTGAALDIVEAVPV